MIHQITTEELNQNALEYSKKIRKQLEIPGKVYYSEDIAKFNFTRGMLRANAILSAKQAETSIWKTQDEFEASLFMECIEIAYQDDADDMVYRFIGMIEKIEDSQEGKFFRIVTENKGELSVLLELEFFHWRRLSDDLPKSFR